MVKSKQTGNFELPKEGRILVFVWKDHILVGSPLLCLESNRLLHPSAIWGGGCTD